MGRYADSGRRSVRGAEGFTFKPFTRKGDAARAQSGTVAQHQPFERAHNFRSDDGALFGQ
jgi:hypothetical protein